MSTRFLDDVHAELAAIDRAGLRRRLRAVSGPLAPEILLDGQRVLQFCSNDYLGFAAHPDLRDAARRSLDQDGTGAGAARLIVGNHPVHQALEQALARWKGTEAALLFGSGFLANVGLPAALAGPDDVIYSDQLNHASLIDGCRLARSRLRVIPHGRLDELREALAGDAQARRRIIVTESLFSMDGDVAPPAPLMSLAREHDAIVVVDEAHAIGALGPAGTGLYAGAQADLHIGTLGKALGSYGAFIAGPRDVIDLLVHRARSFVFTTGLPPSIAAAALAALSLCAGTEGDRLRARLADRVAQLHRGLDALGLPPRPATHIASIVIGDAARTMALTHRLLQRGLYVQGIRPPTVPDDTARLRVSLSSAHEAAHVDRLLEALAAERDALLA